MTFRHVEAHMKNPTLFGPDFILRMRSRGFERQSRLRIRQSLKSQQFSATDSNSSVAWCNMQNAEIRKALTEEADTGLNIPMTTLNAEEGKEYTRIMNQIQTYQDTAVLQFIMGTKSLDEFDSYVSDMKKLEIETAISYQQAALERYNNR